MTEYQGFVHGGAQFPLGTSTGKTLLRDADPAIFYALEYYKSIIETHVGARLLQEAIDAQADQISVAVAETLPLNPEPFLLEEHIKFPLLSVYRKSSSYEFQGQRKQGVHECDVSYVLPPMRASEAERILPVLKAVAAVIDNRTEQGFDPSYTPTSPTGTAGEIVWGASRAGISRIEIMSASYGGYTPSPDVFFPAVVLGLRMKERESIVISEFSFLAGTDAALDIKDPDGTVLSNAVQDELDAAPTLTSLTPTTGTSAGSTPVTITGTRFRLGTVPRVLFDGSDASSVLVVSTTSITCVTPAHGAYPSFAADVEVIAADGQLSNVLGTAFTFTA